MADEPAFLPVGTDVSAKYRGAFCEAKVKKVVRNVKCKVTLKESGMTFVALHDDINGPLKTGHTVEVKHPDSGQFVPCVINKITDQSTYTVVFDDADENTLRRTQLCLKGEKHFVKSDTLDELPLTHPEHFGTPVMRGARSFKSKRYLHNASSDSDSDIESSEEEMVRGRTRGGRRDVQHLIGRVVCVEIEDRKKTTWVPALVVQPSADATERKTPEHILVKSFRDSKFFSVLSRDVKEFSRDMAMKNEDKVLKVAFEKALQYYDTHELPSLWDKEELLGSESESEEDTMLKTPNKYDKNKVTSSKITATPRKTSDEEPSEERDRFVAQLYKFMDDRGTPMNKSPQIANRDLNLYKMFRLVQDMGGYNKVTNQVKWHVIYSKMGLPPTTSASTQIKVAYKKYLHAFEDFDRKLGCTMGTITRPRARHSSGRSLLSFRERDRESTPKSPRSVKKFKDDEDDDVRSNKDVSDRSDVDSLKDDVRLKSHALLQATSSDSETDSVSSRPNTRERESSKPVTREDLTRAREDTGRPVREEARRVRDEAATLRLVREEERKFKEEREPPERDDKEEGRQPKKRGRKKEDGDDEPKKDEKRLMSKRRFKDDSASEVSEDKTEISDEEEEDKEPSKAPYKVGTKLRIKYGKGKNIKIYEAKVIEDKPDGNFYQYKVHYAGWNIRYDEWVKKDRIVSAVDEGSNFKNKPKLSKPTVPPSKTPAKLTPPNSQSKRVLTKPTTSQAAAPSATPKEKQDKEVASAKPKPPPTPVAQTPAKPTAGTGQKTPAAPKTPAPTPTPAPVPTATSKVSSQNASSKNPRPTRSTSIEGTLAIGLQPKRRLRKSSGFGDSESQSRGSDSELSDDESSEEEIPERVTRSRAEADSRTNKESADSAVEVDKTLEVQATETHDVATPSQIKQEPSAKEETKKPRNSANKQDTKTETLPVKSESVKPMETYPLLAKVEVKGEKKVSDKIYDFEDSSSQDSFRENLVLHSHNEPKDLLERGRFRRKDPIKRIRRHSTDSSASNDSTVKAASLKSENVVAEPSHSRATKDTVRVTKRSMEAKMDSPTKPQEAASDKKKTGVKVKETMKEQGDKGKEAIKELIEKVKVKETPKEQTEKPKVKEAIKEPSEKVKAKPTPKTEKSRGKRKVDTAESGPKVEEVDTKKARRKKDPKEDKGPDSPMKETARKMPVDSPSMPEVTCPPEESLLQESDSQPILEATSSRQDSPDKSLSVIPSQVSWSPTYTPAPTLTQTVSIDTKPEQEVMDEPAPQLSPIITGSVVPCSSVVPRQPEESQHDVAPESDDLPPEQKEMGKEKTGTLFDNTPPETPERSPSASQSGGATPTQQDNEVLMHGDMTACQEDGFPEPCESGTPGGESPNTCDTSTVSNGSGGSSGNAPGSESEDQAQATKRLKQEESEEVEEEKPALKRRRRRQPQPKSAEKPAKKTFHKQSMSDSDEQEHLLRSSELSSQVKAVMCNPLPPAQQRVSKYNFLDLQEGKYLEGEDRIKFLMGKIQDIRKLYMQLKSEVACIDRRRKRHRRKIHEAQARAAAAAAVAAVVSRGEAEMS